MERLYECLEENQEALIVISRADPTSENRHHTEQLIQRIRSLQSEIELAQAGHADTELTLNRLTEMKRLIAKPLTTFNAQIFGSMISKVLVTADDTKPNKLRFIFHSGIEVGQGV